MERNYLTESEISDRIDIFYDVIDEVSKVYYPDVIVEDIQDISVDHQEIFEDILNYFVQVVELDPESQVNEDLCEVIAEVFLIETIGDVIAKFSSHGRKEREANRAASEYKKVAKSVSSSGTGYKAWYNSKKRQAATDLHKKEHDKREYHMSKRAALAAKIDRAVDHPVRTAGKLAVGAAKLLAKGVHKVLTGRIKRYNHNIDGRRYYGRRLPRLRAVTGNRPVSTKKS